MSGLSQGPTSESSDPDDRPILATPLALYSARARRRVARGDTERRLAGAYPRILKKTHESLPKFGEREGHVSTREEERSAGKRNAEESRSRSQVRVVDDTARGTKSVLNPRPLKHTSLQVRNQFCWTSRVGLSAVRLSR